VFLPGGSAVLVRAERVRPATSAGGTAPG
jgi:hypothetical protein